MRATRLPLRGGPRTTTSFSGKPAARNRCAIASAATVVLPDESVVLISINCLKMSCASVRGSANKKQKKSSMLHHPIGGKCIHRTHSIFNRLTHQILFCHLFE